MAYTRHGHHIAGTILEENKPPVARCGGPSICSVCALDASPYKNNPSYPKESRIMEPVLTFNQYVRRPFQVEAVQITEENIEEVAALVGSVREKDGASYIALDRRVVPQMSKAQIGWWITRMDDNYRCYSPKVFDEQFASVEPESKNVFDSSVVDDDAHISVLD